jgi:hypothetical protein
VKLEQLAEAKAARQALEASLRVVEQRRQFYEARLEEERSVGEQQHLDKLEAALKHQLTSQGIDLVRAALGYLPDFDIGVSGVSSPVVKARWGSSNILSYMGAISQSFAMDAHRSSHEASKALTEAGYARRAEEWTFQVSQAEAELAHLDKQLAAAALRIAIAERDLASSELQIEQAKAVDAYMRDKYTNQELYGWMLSQLSGVYFQSYQLAYDLAKRAERAFRHELGLAESNYIQFGYWDSLKKGLLAGEKLQLDLRRLEVAYLEQHQREREITQHFSLAMLDPEALLALRETGSCEFEIPELAFDLVYPGHYFRRIKSVSLTIPAVTGPHTNVGATLTLLSNRTRTNGGSQQAYPYTGLDDGNFRHDLVGIESIATSSARNDAGLFQLDFRDERYLPFESAGAVSRFRLSLPRTFRSFDYDTITDVILHMSYTARDGGDALRLTVEEHLEQRINSWLDELAEAGEGLLQLLSLRREFPDALHRLVTAPPPEEGPRATELRIGKRHLPYFVRDRDVATTQVSVLLKLREDSALDLAGLAASVNGVAGAAFAPVPELPGLAESVVPLAQPIEAADAVWTLALAGDLPDPGAIADVMLLVRHRAEAPSG